MKHLISFFFFKPINLTKRRKKLYLMGIIVFWITLSRKYTVSVAQSLKICVYYQQKSIFRSAFFFFFEAYGKVTEIRKRLGQAYLCCVSFPATTKRWGFPLKVSQRSQISGMEAQKSVTTWTVFRDWRRLRCHPQILVSIGCFETWVGGSCFRRHKY